MRYLLLLSTLLFAACADQADTSTDTAAPIEEPAMTAPPPPVEIPEPEPEPQAEDPLANAGTTFNFTPGGPISDEDLANYYVEMECAVDGESVGTMVITFWPEKAPVTVRNFLRYCSEGFYEGVTFHRILRDFMVQGGDPTGTGSGDGTYGTIQGEFSDDAEFSHEYGVISMARGQSPDSASCQFFICAASNASTWNLDGQYASFGKLVSGVDTLEAMANVPTTMSSGGEQSKPTQTVTILRTTIKQGMPDSMETIERPQPDFGGEPAKVTVRHVLISFNGAQRSTETRTKEEAEVLANEILERVKGGEDIDGLIREYSSDPIAEGDSSPGTYSMLNTGAFDVESERAMLDLQERYQTFVQDLQAQRSSGTITTQQFTEQLNEFQQTLQLEAKNYRFVPREQMVSAFGDVAFGLEVGEVGMAAYDPSSSPFGWHIILRTN